MCSCKSDESSNDGGGNDILVTYERSHVILPKKMNRCRSESSIITIPSTSKREWCVSTMDGEIIYNMNPLCGLTFMTLEQDDQQIFNLSIISYMIMKKLGFPSFMGNQYDSRDATRKKVNVVSSNLLVTIIIMSNTKFRCDNGVLIFSFMSFSIFFIWR